MIDSFFEGNSVSLEVFELFDDFCLEKPKKTALNAVRRELAEEYKFEKDLYITFLMTLYYCGLKKNFIDEKSKNELVKLTNDEIREAFGETDGKVVSEVLIKLLEMSPIKPERPKIDYSNPGCKNWQVGDLYAYKLSGDEIKDVGLEGSYAIIHCMALEVETKRTTNVKLYLHICDKDFIDLPPEEVLKKSYYLLSSARHRLYMYKLISSHHEYPTNQLRYLGNVTHFEKPEGEYLPKDEFFIPLLIWKRFESDIVNDKSEMDRNI